MFKYCTLLKFLKSDCILSLMDFHPHQHLKMLNSTWRIPLSLSIDDNTSPCCIHTLGLTMISMCRVLSSTTRLMASRLIHKLLVLKILWKNNRLYMKNCCLMLVEGWWLCYDCMTGYLLKFADTFKFIYLKAESNSFNSYKQLCTNYKLFHKKSFKLLHSVIFILYVHNVPMIFKGAWSISA